MELLTIFLSTTVWTLLGPVLEYLVTGLLMVMELLGLERFSPEQTIIAVVGVTSLLTIYKQFSGQKGWKEKMFGMRGTKVASSNRCALS